MRQPSPLLDDFPLRQRESAVFGGSRRRSRVVVTATLLAVLAVVIWGALLALGLDPAHLSGTATLFVRHARHPLSA